MAYCDEFRQSYVAELHHIAVVNDKIGSKLYPTLIRFLHLHKLALIISDKSHILLGNARNNMIIMVRGNLGVTTDGGIITHRLFYGCESDTFFVAFTTPSVCL